jgi:general secretion pathway protein L
MTELRIYARRESADVDGPCAWALLDQHGHVARSGNTLADLPRVSRCRLVLASELVLFARLTLPAVSRGKLAALLANAMEAHCLEDAEELHSLPAEKPQDGETWVAAVSRTWLTRVLQRLAALDVYPDTATPEALLLPWQPGQWSVLCHSEGSVLRQGVALSCLDRGEPPVGLQLVVAGAARPASLQLWHAGRLHAPDATAWSRQLNLPVEAMGAWDWRTAAWPVHPLNLLDGLVGAPSARTRWGELLKPLAWGLALLAGVQLAGSAVYAVSLSNEQKQLLTEQRQLAARALPAGAAVVDPVWQVGEALKRASGQGAGQTGGLNSLLERLGQAWPQGTAPKWSKLNYGGGRLDLTLAEADLAWLDELSTAASERGLVVSNEKSAQGGVTLHVTEGAQHAR